MFSISDSYVASRAHKLAYFAQNPDLVQTNRQIDRQTDRQTERRTDKTITLPLCCARVHGVIIIVEVLYDTTLGIFGGPAQKYIQHL